MTPRRESATLYAMEQKDKYEIEPAWKKAEKYPDTFKIPSADKLAYLKPGDAVKIVFRQAGCPNERMWVRIAAIKGDRFVGVLDNVPLCIDMSPGDPVAFYASDIVDVYGADSVGTVLLWLAGAAALGFMGWAIYRSINPQIAPAPPALPPPSPGP